MMLAATMLALTLLAAAPALADDSIVQRSTAALTQFNQGDQIAVNVQEQEQTQRQFAPGGEGGDVFFDDEDDVKDDYDPWGDEWGGSWGDDEWEDHNGDGFDDDLDIDASGGAGGTQEAVQVGGDQTAVAVGPTFDATQTVDSFNFVGHAW